MSTRREGEHRVTEQYREPLGSVRGGLGIGQAAPWFAICFIVILIGLILGGWMFMHWWVTDAWNTHPLGVIAVNTSFISLMSTFILWKMKVAYDKHIIYVRRAHSEIDIIDEQPYILREGSAKGFNSEFEEGIVRVINPASLAQASKETNNYYGDEGEDVPQIEAPRGRDEDDYLNISADYQPHADDFLSGRKLIAGISGSGKSNSVATICEEYGRLGVPMLLADTENEYRSLGNQIYLPNALLAGREQVTPDNAEQFGHYILDNHKQVILDLTDYDDVEESAWVMVNIIKGMRAWQEKFANELRIPCEFLLEEAPTWLPQNVGESPLKGTDVWQPLQDAFFNNLVRKGRKRGLGVTIICQRVAEIDKRALQSDVKILHRQTEINDLKKYKEMGVTNEETVALQNGEAYYFSSNVSKMLIQMRLRRSKHEANTPGLKALKAHRIAEEPITPDFQSLSPLRENGNGHQRPVYGGLGGFPAVYASSPTTILDGRNYADWEDGTDTVIIEPVEPLPGELPINFQPSNSSADGKYKFSPDDARLVVELYKAYRSIDKVLAHMERGGRWHKDASRLIKEAGLS